MSAERDHRRYEAAVMLAEAIVKTWPSAAIGELGLTRDGFRCDAALPAPLADGWERQLNRALRGIAKRGPSSAMVLAPDEAREALASQPFQLKLLDGREARESDPVVRARDTFTVLADAPDVDALPVAEALTITTSSGAYWGGDGNAEMLTRFSGLAFENEAELTAHLRLIEHARERDHRRLGRTQRIFATSDELGAGLPIWLPNGTVVRRQLEWWISEVERQAGYDHIVTPQLARQELYARSGHLEHYSEDMFPVMDLGGDSMVLRPMNCPHHITTFALEPHSYRDLPVRLAELGTMYRNERSGVVSGLSRVRAMTLNDAHIFCTVEQIADEFVAVLEMIEDCYSILGITEQRYRLSLRDTGPKSEKYVDNDEMWERAEMILRDAMARTGLPYTEAPGEAAFYGPKLDIQLPDLFGREETVSTIQIDFHLPEQFDLSYVGSDGERHRPVIIHRGVLSTMERMTSYLIERYEGDWPIWLSPKQIAIVPVTESQDEEARDWARTLTKAGLRVSFHPADAPLGARVGKARAERPPFIAVIGEQESTDGTASVRRRGSKESHVVDRDEFSAEVLQLITTRSLDLMV